MELKSDLKDTLANEQSGSQENTEDFASMLAEQTVAPQANLHIGQKVEGVIVAITNDSVFVNIGTKIDAIAMKADLDARLFEDTTDANGEIISQALKIGDKVEWLVLDLKPGEIKLGQYMTSAEVAALEAAMQNQQPVQGKIIAPCKGGYTVEIIGSNKKAFCPGSQLGRIDFSQMAKAKTISADTNKIESATTESAQTKSDSTGLESATDTKNRFSQDAINEILVGETFAFLILRLEKNGRNIVLSRRLLLDKERESSLAKATQEIKEGDVITGTVRRIADFGVFVEILPGIDGLIPMSELSWAKNKSVTDIVQIQDQIKVKVLEVKENEKNQLRISLSLKQTLSDPWADFPASLKTDAVLEGIVTRTVPFGVFVELFPGIEGLVHISELSWSRKIRRVEEVANVGDKLQVLVKDIDLDTKRISLSLRAVEGDPWQEAVQKYSIGTTVKGQVESHTQYGIFVTLEPGITGLLPAAFIRQSSLVEKLHSLEKGEEVELQVQNFDLENRRISLAPYDLEESWVKNEKEREREKELSRQQHKEHQQNKNIDNNTSESQKETPTADASNVMAQALAAAMAKKKEQSSV